METADTAFCQKEFGNYKKWKQTMETGRPVERAHALELGKPGVDVTRLMTLGVLFNFSLFKVRMIKATSH